MSQQVKTDVKVTYDTPKIVFFIPSRKFNLFLSHVAECFRGQKWTVTKYPPRDLFFIQSKKLNSFLSQVPECVRKEKWT